MAKNPRRRFTLQQRRALYLVADGRCESCGEVLSEDWQADHVTPWSSGGATDVINGQALCPRCNLAKGSKVTMTWEKLRAWQKRFAEKFRSHTGKDFLLVVLPAGGKTIAALWVAQEWLQKAGFKRRMVIHVSPLYDLKTQFRKTAHDEFGLEFQTKELGEDIKSGFHGLCLTYSGMAAAAASIRRLCSKYEVFVIFDEPHHLSTEATWGRKCREAFEFAFMRLFMTGTPWRTDCDDIPFLQRDENGNYVKHDCFDWPLALEEEEPPHSGKRCIRILTFRDYDDVVDCERGGQMFTLDSREELTHEEQDRWLRGAIRGQAFADKIIGDAHEQLLKIRVVKPDAAGLVVCEDIDESFRVAKTLQRATGVRPYLIVSDDDKSNGDDVKAFKENHGTWIVSVRKVSEGINIPRLMVGVFLSNYTTELYFRQFVGRVMRNEGTDFDKEAYIYMPRHYALTEYANKIKEMQAIALKRKGPPGPPPPPGKPTTYLGDHDTELGEIIIPGYGEADPVQINLFMDRYRSLGATETLAAQLWRDQVWAVPPTSPEADKDRGPSIDDQPLEVRLDYWRQANESKLRHYAILRGAKDDPRLYSDVRMEVNNHMGVRDIKRATIEQLKKGCDYLDELIQNTTATA